MGFRLLNCPFCGCGVVGSYLYDRYFEHQRWKVCCGKCSAQIYRGTQKEAEEAWNRRYLATEEVDFDYAAEDGNG